MTRSLVMGVLRRLSLVLAGLTVWELVARSGLFSPIIVPSLARIGRELWFLATSAGSLVEVWQSLFRGLSGFALAAAVGVTLGVVMGRSAVAAAFLSPIFSGTYPIPKIALFPIFIYLFGIGSLAAFGCQRGNVRGLYPIVVTTHAGSRAVNRVLLWSAANMGASRGRIVARVVVPAAAPFIFAGLRIALPIAMIVVIITEMISSADGLGYLVMYSLASFKTDRMLAAVVVISLLGLALDRLVVGLRDRLVFWERLDSYYAE